MTRIDRHTITDAPEASRPLLEGNYAQTPMDLPAAPAAPAASAASREPE